MCATLHPPKKGPEWTKGRQTCSARLLCLICFGKYKYNETCWTRKFFLIWTGPGKHMDVLAETTDPGLPQQATSAGLCSKAF